MTAATLIVLAPCSLLVGAVLQVLIARLCSARTKGILAVLTCLPAVIAVVGMLKYVQSGQAVELNLFGWDGPLALVLHVDALSVLFAFMGACLGGIVLLYSVGYMAEITGQ
jgi:NADH:ubiquinone oxidoreductase subunit 5 (subunit L)/multisubunit Na+/H+ antiporter MnhA subunit